MNKKIETIAITIIFNTIKTLSSAIVFPLMYSKLVIGRVNNTSDVFSFLSRFRKSVAKNTAITD
jgi:hypothetical protein